MATSLKTIVAYFKQSLVKVRILKYILAADLFLLLAALFLERILLRIRGTGISITPKELPAFWTEPLPQLMRFTGTQWVSLVTPALALYMARFAHQQDDEKHGRGVKDIINQHGRRKAYNLETDVIAASMTKQSVLAAIASILVVVIQPSQNSGFLAW